LYLTCRNNQASDSEDSEEFEDTKGVIRIRISKMNRQHNGQKGQTMIYKTYT